MAPVAPGNSGVCHHSPNAKRLPPTCMELFQIAQPQPESGPATKAASRA
ncbi:hypothetical protein RISK_004763 [Rhodopirellula islandica]|uniref:Uncharacterized protein n=1 Tax=Rhodopirellula islandica TaxID=595434 RepID=A0A0J1BAE5_RHOIS|nr:hypothetical protein RISK_004763 [Rhodopirellula islandica]